MPVLSSRTDEAAASGVTAVNRPWLRFFREVRRLAAKLDALEAERDGTDAE